MRIYCFGLVLAALVFSQFSDATLVGDDIGGEYRHFVAVSSTGPGFSIVNEFESASGSGSTATVDALVEFLYEDSHIRIAADFSGDVLSIDYTWSGPIITGPGPFDTITATLPRHILRFTDLDWVDASGTITGFNLVSGSSPILDSYSHGPDSVQIDFDGFVLDAPGSFHLEFEIEGQHGAPVPEPASATILGLGLAALVSRRLRRTHP